MTIKKREWTGWGWMHKDDIGMPFIVEEKTDTLLCLCKRKKEWIKVKVIEV